MIPDIRYILTEWSYRVGAIDYKNEKHLYHLNEILIEKGWPYTIIEELIQNLTEDDIVRNKKSGNTYVVKTHNKDTQDLIKKDASDDEIKKVKQDKDETNNTEYLKNLDIEVAEGLSDEEISSIVKTEKERRKFIGETVDILISQIGQQRGAGAYNVDRKDLQSLKSFAEGKGPKVENYSINQDLLAVVLPNSIYYQA